MPQRNALVLSKRASYKNHIDSYMERLSIIVKYNPSTDSWKSMGNLLTARYEHAAIRSLVLGRFFIWLSKFSIIFLYTH